MMSWLSKGGSRKGGASRKGPELGAGRSSGVPWMAHGPGCPGSFS